MVNLGFMELPLSGPMSMVIASAGMAVGAVSAMGMLDLANMLETNVFEGVKRGPGALAENPLKALNLTMLASVAWMIVYYNFLFSQIGLTTAVHVFKMIDPKKVNADQMVQVASRFHGNMKDHDVVFMTSLWVYSLLVDAFSGGVLGFCYVAARLVYPFFYMHQGSFTFYFEFITQIGYAAIGVLMYGIVYNAAWGPNGLSPSGCKNEATGEVKDFATKISGGCTMCAGTRGWALACLTLFPGVPFGPVYAFLQYLAHTRWHFVAPKQAAAVKGASIELPSKEKGA